ncbi:MAG: hypothetical protein M1269_08440 [Chloroflexi bacterium]|nr:hypothetical protein [Chloroflexota bacterium]
MARVDKVTAHCPVCNKTTVFSKSYFEETLPDWLLYLVTGLRLIGFLFSMVHGLFVPHRCEECGHGRRLP